MPNHELMLLCGKTASGKSSLCEELVRRDTPSGVRHLPMGARLRAISRGQIASRYGHVLQAEAGALARHEPAPHDMAVAVFEEFLEQAAPGLVLVDGFPRYPDRLPGFYESVQRMGARVLGICHVTVDNSTAWERLRAREQRSADVRENTRFFRERMADYRTQVLPTMNELADHYPLHSLDGTRPLDENAAALLDLYEAARLAES